MIIPPGDWGAQFRWSFTDPACQEALIKHQPAMAALKVVYDNDGLDADGEVAETQNWLEFARACGYLTDQQHHELWIGYEQVSSGLVKMISDADAWCGPS